MNLCFLQGKVVSRIEFNFILNSKNISITNFEIELSNKSIITIKAYNELADFCYSKLKQNNEIFIYGYICENIIIAEDIIKEKQTK